MVKRLLVRFNFRPVAIKLAKRRPYLMFWNQNGQYWIPVNSGEPKSLLTVCMVKRLPMRFNFRPVAIKLAKRRPYLMFWNQNGQYWIQVNSGEPKSLFVL